MPDQGGESAEIIGGADAAIRQQRQAAAGLTGRRRCHQPAATGCLINQHTGVKLLTMRKENLNQRRGSDAGKAAHRIKHRRGKRAFWWGHNAGGAHQYRQNDHRLSERLQDLQQPEILSCPVTGDLCAQQAGGHQQANARRQHPAAVDPADIQQGRNQRCDQQLRQTHRQRQRGKLKGAKAADLSKIGRRQRGARKPKDEHAGQAQQAMRQIWPSEHLQFKQRQR